MYAVIVPGGWVILIQTGARREWRTILMKKSLFMILGVALVAMVIAALYRSANNADLPDDEWFEFENLPT